MWASPIVQAIQKAKGWQAERKGLRILPWAVYKHAKEILPDVVLMENVEEIQQWGPLDEKVINSGEKRRGLQEIYYGNEESRVPFR